MTKRLISCLLCLCTLIGFAAVAYADDPVEVVFWNGYTGSDQPTLEAIVETYNNSQDKVRIKMEIMPWDTLYQKLMPAFIAGNAPDLIGFSVTRYMEYAMAGKLEPLDAFIASSETITMDNLVQGLFKAGNYDGKQYTLPMACAAMVMYYNKDMFREAGLDAENPPATMEELYAAWDKLIQKDGNGNVTQYAQAIGVKSTVAMMPVFMWAYGADYIKDGKSVLDSDEATAAMTMIADAYAKGVSPVGLTGQEADDLFAAGKAAIEFNGQWAAPGFRAAGIDLGIAQTVTLSDGTVFQLDVASIKKHEKQIAVLQRQLCRNKEARQKLAKLGKANPFDKREPSRKRRRLKAKIQNHHRCIRNIRRDFMLKTAHTIAQNYGGVAMEDLKLKNMTKSAKGTVEEPGKNVRQKTGLNRSLARVAPYAMRMAIHWAVFKANGRLILVDPKYTSQTCPICGCTSSSNRPSQAHFGCQKCGYTANADVVGATNVLKKSRTGSVRPCSELGNKTATGTVLFVAS